MTSTKEDKELEHHHYQEVLLEMLLYVLDDYDKHLHVG